MKKVLLVGKFTDHFREVNKYLSKDYEVRACVNKLEIFKGMFKLNMPDIVVMILGEMCENNESLFQEMAKEYADIPVVCGGLKAGEEDKLENLDANRFVFISESFSQHELMEMIEMAFDENFWAERMQHSQEAETEEEEKEETEEEVVEEEQEAPSPKKVVKDTRKSILVVDDSGIYLRMMNGLLADDYDVRVTTSGLKALPLIREKRPDLILLDYEMPLCDGRETMIKIRQIEGCEDIPIVFVTAVNRKENITAVLSLKPAGYLLKPIDKERTLKIVKGILSKE